MVADLSGQTLEGRYQLLAIAGQGGMATVYKAQVVGSEQLVAIKYVRPEYRAIKHYIEMFKEEARVGSELAHPNIVQVYEVRTDAGYLVMEWIEGIDLGGLIKVYRGLGHHIAWPIAVMVGIGTLHGLGAAHSRIAPDGTPAPVIHRDISPQNVLLGTGGEIKLSDFGLARARDRAASLTAPGTVKGKLNYLAPEVTTGKPNTVQSDLFGVGNLLWETLAAERLFEGRTDVDVFRKIRACKVPPIGERRPDLPPGLVGVLDIALAHDPARRFASAAAFANALGEVLQLVAEPPDLGATIAAVTSQG